LLANVFTHFKISKRQILLISSHPCVKTIKLYLRGQFEDMRSWKSLAIAAILPIQVFAQQAEELKEVIVSDNRIQVPLSETSRNIVVISQREIENLPVQNINELIQTVAGIDVRQRGAWGMQGDVSTRGGTFEQTLILLNGIKMNDPQTGHHNLNLGVDLENIERIEIIKGPAASRYGLNSFSGVINIVTKKAAKNDASIGLAAMQSAGNNPLHETNAGYTAKSTLNFVANKWSNTAQVNRTQSTGYRANTDFIRHQLMYQTQLETKAGEFKAMASYLDNAFGASGFYAYPIDSTSTEIVRTGLIALMHSKNFGRFSWNTKAYWRNNYDEYTLFKERPSAYQNKHTTDVFGAETHGTYAYKFGKVGLGLEARDERILSTNLGNHERLNIGLFAENRSWFLKEKLNIGVGFYLNQSNVFGTQFLPSLDASYKVTNTLSGFANYGTSFRVPSFTDLYYVGPTNIGNADLKPEEAVNYELGAKWFSKMHQLQASVFLQESNNLIDWVRNSTDDPWQPKNYESATTQGLDLNYKWLNLKEKKSKINLNTFSIGYTYLNIGLNSESEVISRYALTHLSHQLSTRFSVAVYDRLMVNIAARYFDRISYKSYWLIDSRVMLKGKSVDVFADCTNMLNSNYIEAAQALMPGRWLRLGANIRL
jgi:vitamin B12 transporter